VPQFHRQSAHRHTIAACRCRDISHFSSRSLPHRQPVYRTADFARRQAFIISALAWHFISTPNDAYECLYFSISNEINRSRQIYRRGSSRAKPTHYLHYQNNAGHTGDATSNTIERRLSPITNCHVTAQRHVPLASPAAHLPPEPHTRANASKANQAAARRFRWP